MINIINPDHFAFFSYDMSIGKEPEPKFYAGTGAFTLINDS